MSIRPPSDDEWRFHYARLLEEFGKFNTEFRAYQTERERVLREMEERLMNAVQVHWLAAAAALRQLSDWQAEAEQRVARRYKILIAIGVVLVLMFALIMGGLYLDLPHFGRGL